MPNIVDRFARGTLLRGKYRVERVLGEGGMGIVLLAMHTKLEQRVAVKVLSPSVQGRATLHARFGREARAAAKLRSPHVVRVLDVDETEDGLPFLVMEYLVGTDLETCIRRDGPLSAELAARHVLQACEAVAEAHASGIVHRDLKPANLFLARGDDGEAVLKVLDFGIAKAIDGGDDLSLTATSGAVGSPLYMSPEQLKGAPDVDGRTDIWSLGVVLYELVSGKSPFAGPSLTALAARIAADPPTPLETHCPAVPKAYLEAVMRCLEKTPERRFGSVLELAEALAPVLGNADEPAKAQMERIVRAATRRPALADTVPGGEAPPLPRSTAPARVTAAVTEDADAAPRDVPAEGGRTDYGSEIASEPEMPATKPPPRRTWLLVGAGLVAVAAAGFMLRLSGEPVPSKVTSATPASSSSSARDPAFEVDASDDARAIAPATGPAAHDAGAVAPPIEPPRTSASAQPAVTTAPPQPRPAASPPIPPPVAPPASPAISGPKRNPLDIELK